MAFCYDCPRNVPELPYLSFANRKYKVTEKLNDPKLIVDPDEAGCYFMHWNACGAPTKILDNQTAFIIHFENLYEPRWEKTNDGLLKTGYDLDNKRMPLLRCDPNTIFNFSKIDTSKSHSNIKEVNKL
jgi:hypothetical protein